MEITKNTILNKWDTQNQEKKTFKKAEENIKIMFGHMNYAPILPISAKEDTGIKQLLNTVMELYNQLNRKIDTASLNTALRDWVTAYPPPASRSASFKMRYITQTSVNPVEFLIFATRPEVVQQTYLSYIKNKVRTDLGFDKIPVKNKVRTDLGFDKIPVKVELKASRTKWENRSRT